MKEVIDLKKGELSFIKAMLENFLPSVKVIAYGSRVNGNAKAYSDLDLAIFAKPQEENAVADLREAFENSDLPFRVELFVWGEIPPEFQANILQKHYIL